MIEVKMYLYDAQEIALMAQFDAILAQKRAGENTAPASPLTGVHVEAPTDTVVKYDTPEGTLAAHAQAAPQTQSTPEPDTTPDVLGAGGGPAPMPVEVDDVTMQRTITTYGQKHGVPATVARMQELFGVSQASKVPVERRAEFVEAFAV